ncbi:MAG TPA: hypothetical protein EYP10_11380, partial [Armatimonadetes bacterium]|nr:hypothetical protein [Armatimonadota bacterium]
MRWLSSCYISQIGIRFEIRLCKCITEVISMRIIAVGICIGICIVVQPCTTATLFNGDFERVHDNKPVGWEGDCVARGGKVWRWRYFKARFNTREYRRIRIYLRMQFAVGKVWFDDVSVSGLKIANASFEQAYGNDITAWQQDDVGRTIFIDRAIAHSGKCSVRIECKQKRMSRIWQTVDCKPNTWHDFSFWAQCEGIKFNIAYGEIYGIKPDGSHGKILTQVGNMAGTTDEEHGNYVCEIRRDALGDALAWRFAQLPPNANLLLRCDVKTERLNEGVAIFRIADANGHALGRVTAERKVGWQSLAVNVKTPTTGRIKIALGIENGRGTVWFDNIKVMKHSIVPPPQKITWLPASDNFKLTRDAVIVVRDGASGRDLTGVQMLQREVHHIARIKLPIVEASKWHGGRAIIVGEANAPHVARTIAEEKITVPNRDEGYALIVTPKRIVVAGHDPAGTFYGIMTLLQMLVRYGDDAEIVAVRIEDYPDLPFRCTYGLYAGNAQIAAETFARLKLNAVLYESGAYYSLDDERIR